MTGSEAAWPRDLSQADGPRKCRNGVGHTAGKHFSRDLSAAYLTMTASSTSARPNMITTTVATITLANTIIARP